MLFATLRPGVFALSFIRKPKVHMTASAPQPTQLTIREVLRLKPVRRLWTAQVVSIFGDFLALFAVLIYVSFNLGASAAQVTLISVAFMLPFGLIGPIAGV